MAASWQEDVGPTTFDIHPMEINRPCRAWLLTYIWAAGLVPIQCTLWIMDLCLPGCE